MHLAETTNGKNGNPVALHNRCKTIGMSNEYGYAPFTPYTLPDGTVFKGRCFTTHDEATETVVKWFEDHLDEYSVSEALCLYNTGRATQTCPYHRNYTLMVGR